MLVFRTTAVENGVEVTGEWIVRDGEKKSVRLVLSDFLYAQVIEQQRRFRLVAWNIASYGGV